MKMYLAINELKIFRIDSKRDRLVVELKAEEMKARMCPSGKFMKCKNNRYCVHQG